MSHDAMDDELRLAFRKAESRRFEIEGPLNGFARGYEIADKLKPLFPQWFRHWLEQSNWCEVCINNGYDSFFLFVEEMGYTKDRWLSWAAMSIH